MWKQIRFVILIAFLCLAAGGCRGMSVQVAQAAPVSKTNKEVPVEVRNCVGKEELQLPLEAEREVVQQVEIADEAIYVEGGDPMPLTSELKAQLEDQVLQAYQQKYEEAQNTVKQTYLVVPIGKVRTFNIYCSENTYSATISLKMNFQTYEVPYTYRLTIPYINDYLEISCTG